MKKIVSLFCVALSFLTTGVEGKEYQLGPIAQNFYSDQFLSRSPFGDNHKAVRGFVAGNIYASLQSKFETTKPQLSGTGASSFNIGIAFNAYLNRQFDQFAQDSDLKAFFESKKKGSKEVSLLTDAYYVGEVNEQIFLEAIDSLLTEKFVAEIGRKLNASEKEKIEKIKLSFTSQESFSIVSKEIMGEDEEVTEEEFQKFMNTFEGKMKEIFSRRPKK